MNILKSSIITMLAACTLMASCRQVPAIDKSFYVKQVEDIFAYWSEYRDSEFGGILNCISNDGNTLVSKDKYAWSQGRWLYILSKIKQM